MGILSNLQNAFRQKSMQVFNVSEFNSMQQLMQIVQSDNYLDQYTSWTYKATKLKADSIAGFDFTLYKNKKNPELINEHQLLSELERFNPFQTIYDAKRLTQMHLDLVGCAYWVIVDPIDKVDGNRFDFFIINSQRVSVVTDKMGLPAYYEYTQADGGVIRINNENIIPFIEPNPKNWLQGYSALEASRYAHNTHEFALKYNMAVFGNGGRPDGFIIVPDIDETSQQALEVKLKSKFGGVQNARRIGVSNAADMKWIEISKTPKDLDYTQALDKMRDLILAMHGVPLDLIGVGGTTFANAENAQRYFEKYTLKPQLKFYENVLNTQLIPKVSAVLKDKQVFFKLPDPVQVDAVAMANKAALLFEKGVVTRNESREMVGVEAAKDGDVFITDINKPLPIVAPATNETKSIDDTDEIEKKRQTLKDIYLQKNLASEQNFYEYCKKYFDGQAKRVLKNQKAVSMKYSLDMETENKIGVEVFAPAYKSEAEKYNAAANELLDTSNAITDATRAKLADQLEYFVGEINNTTKNDLERILSNAIENDTSIADVTEQIRELYTNYTARGITESRAEMIARTEVNKIKNEVSRANYAQNRFVTAFEWLAAQDSDTRLGHSLADGQVVEKGKKFMVGGEYLEYPGDPNGRPDNIINCRCTVLPVVE